MKLGRFSMPLTLSVVAILFCQLTFAAQDRAGATDAESGQDTKAKVDADSLDRLTKHTRYLASDDLEGRGVQTKGIAVAADYIRDEFRRIGLTSGTKDGSYFQYFDVSIREKNEVNKERTHVRFRGVSENSKSLKMGTDFQALEAGGGGAVKGDVVFVGYGINAPFYNDYADIDVKGKIVMMLRREPQQNNADSKFDGKNVTPHSYVATKIRAATAAGAAGMILVNDGLNAPTAEKDVLEPSSGFGRAVRNAVPMIHITRHQANAIIAKAPLDADGTKLDSLAGIESHIDKHFKPVSQSLKSIEADCSVAFSRKTVKAWNVIGVLEGEGPLKDEFVVVGAHYDHLGYGGYGSRKRGSSEIHNGADDNATGTAAVIELAERFATAGKKPPRTMIFIAFSGEERGLVGSRYYVDNPTVPIKSIVAMLNFDMIGNLRNNTATVGGVATGSGLEAVARAADEATPVKMNVRGGARGGSDHLNFIRATVPSMFCNTGLTQLYHTPEDDYETLNMPGMVLVVDYCEKLLQGVVAIKEKPKFLQATRQRRATVVLGVSVAQAEEGSAGLRVQRVSEDSNASRAGLKVGDVLLSFAGKKLGQRVELFTVLRTMKPDTKAKMVIMRDGEKKELEVHFKK